MSDWDYKHSRGLEDGGEELNNNGQIVGFGVNPLGRRETFLLTPVPLPGSVWLFGAGLLTLLVCRARTA